MPSSVTTKTPSKASEVLTPFLPERSAGRPRFPPRGWRDFLWQLGLWLGFGLAYELARGLADRGAGEALANARSVMDAERELGVYVEARIQRAVLDVEPALDAVNWTYWLAQFAVLGLALL
jgi:hypothetical protein